MHHTLPLFRPTGKQTSGTHNYTHFTKINHHSPRATLHIRSEKIVNPPVGYHFGGQTCVCVFVHL